MNALSKIMKSRTLKEAVLNIPDSAFDTAGIIAAVMFVLGPAIQFLHKYLSPVFPSLMREINSIVLLLGGLTLLLYAIKKIIVQKENPWQILKRHYAIALAGVFAILMVVTTLLNSPSEITIFGEAYRKEGLVGFLSYIVYFLLMAINRNERQKKMLLCVFLSITAFASCLHVYIHYTCNITIIEFTLHNSNHYGYLLATAIIVFAMQIIVSRKILFKVLCGFGMIVTVLTLLINNTLGAELAVYVTCFAICIIYSLSKGGFKAITLIPLAILAVTIAFGALTSIHIRTHLTSNNTQLINDMNTEGQESSTGTARIRMWLKCGHYISERAFVGYGSDATGDRLLADTQISDRCHNEYINYAVSFGVPATAFYIAAIFAVYLRGLKHRRELTDSNLIGLCSALAYLISALVGNTMYYTAPYLFIMLGMGYFKKSENKTV